MGAGDREQAIYYTKRLWKITYMITIVINAVILLGLPLILKIFALSSEAYRYAYILVMIHDGMAMFLWPTSFTMPNALRAAGDVKFCMVISIFSMFVFRIFFSVIFGIWLGYGAVGVWVAMVLDWFSEVFYLHGDLYRVSGWSIMLYKQSTYYLKGHFYVALFFCRKMQL